MVYILPDEKDSETNEDQPKEPETTVEEVDQDTTEEDNKEKDPDEEKHPKADSSLLKLWRLMLLAERTTCTPT